MHSPVAISIGAAHTSVGTEYVGRGVNIFHEAYLDPPNKSRIVATDAPVETIPINTTGLKETYGKDFGEFLQNFAVEAGVEGSYMGFSASVEAQYSLSVRESITTQFAHLSVISSGAIVSLSSDPRTLRKFLDSNFKDAVEKDDPKDLFKAYGTHVAVKVKIGGMLSYYSNSKSTEHQSERDFKAAARFKYEGFGAAVGANAGLTEEQKKLAETVEGSRRLLVNGGSDATRIAVEQGDKDSYVAWAGTLGTHPGFIGLMHDSLVPIWLLAETDERRKAIELAFRQEAARLFQIFIFSQTSPILPGPEAEVRLPQNYKLLGGGARENWTGAGNFVTASYAPNNASWLARGKDHWVNAPASITVFALAIYDNLNLWEVKQVSATSGKSSRPSAEVALPQDFIDAGGVLIGGGAQAAEAQMLTASYPKDSKTWAASAADPVDTRETTVTVYARGLRCRVEGVKLAVHVNPKQSQLSQAPSAKSSVDQDFTLAGGGAVVDYGTGPGNMLTTFYPDDEKTWTASSKELAGKPSPATITAFAIGLEVS